MKILILLVGISFSFTINAQWTELNTGTSEMFTSVFCTSPDTAFAVTSDFDLGGKIYATTNGEEWYQQYSSDYYLFSIFFVSEEVGWAGGGIVGDNGIILKTTDRGLNWNQQTTNVEQIHSIYFINDSIGWAIGNDGTQGTHYIYNTTNGGSTWNIQKTGIGYLKSTFFRNDILGWVAGNNGNIFRTTDGGINWSLQSVDTTIYQNFHFKSICFASDSVGWVVGSYQTGGCYTTAYDSIDWVLQNTPSTESLQSIHFISKYIGWAVGGNGTIINTLNGGDNWSAVNSPTSETLLSVSFVDSSTGYAVGDNGTILKYDSFMRISHYNEDNNPIIFPNPSEGKFNVILDNKEYEEEEISLEVYNINGERIFYSSFNQDITKEVDISYSQKGIYFVKIGGLKKMRMQKIIIK